MDQDADNINGELLDDIFQGQFTIDNIGPNVVQTSLTGALSAPFNTLTVEFDEAIEAASLAPRDLLIRAPNGELSATSVTVVNDTTIRFDFPAQQTPGDYQLVIGPGIEDLVGNGMSHDGDLIFGEADDAFVLDLNLTLPDLTVGSVIAPQSIFNGQTLQVEWTITNSPALGTQAAAAPWNDVAVLSRDEFFGNSDDLLIGNIASDASLAFGESVVRQAELKIPFGITGEHRVFFRADRFNQLVEGDAGGEDNNLFESRIDINFAPPPADLIVDALTIPDAAQTGQSIDLLWRVANIGTAQTPGERLVRSSRLVAELHLRR